MPSTAELAEILHKSAPEHEGWSLVESPNSADRYEELQQWAAGMTYQTWSGDLHLRGRQLGLVLLWLESEAARRHGGEGTLWPILSNRTLVPWASRVHSELFTGAGHATQTHRDLLRKAARTLLSVIRSKRKKANTGIASSTFSSALLTMMRCNDSHRGYPARYFQSAFRSFSKPMIRERKLFSRFGDHCGCFGLET